jgi:hypothetical protein
MNAKLWFATAMVLGLSAPALADTRPSSTVLGRMFAPKRSGPTVRSGPVVTAPHSPEVLSDALRAEQEAYLRRLSVCGELRRVAGEKNDDALLRQVEELERQAALVYNQRVAALGVPKVAAPVPDTSVRVAAARLNAPTTPTPDTAIRTADAGIREVKP